MQYFSLENHTVWKLFWANIQAVCLSLSALDVFPDKSTLVIYDINEDACACINLC